MPEIFIKVKNSIALCNKTGVLTTGMVGVRAVFEFDKAWDGLRKMIVYRNGYNEISEELSVSGSTIVPLEMLQEHNSKLYIGVQGLNMAGDIVIPTIFAFVGTVEIGADAFNLASKLAAYPLFKMISEAIGCFDQNLVTAVYDLIAKITGTIDEEDVQEAVANYLKDNPALFTVEIDQDENSTYVSDKSYAEIADAKKAGKTVCCVVGSLMLPLKSISEKSAIFQNEIEKQYFFCEITADGTIICRMGNYALSNELKNEFQIFVSGNSSGSFEANATLDEIKDALDGKRSVSCLLAKEDEIIRLPLTYFGVDTAVFSEKINSCAYKVTISSDGVSVDCSVYSEYTDEKYFDIDYDGLISLKPEYRGFASELYISNYPYCESDNGAGKEGSKISELPERIIIPENINGEQVVGFQKGAFCSNMKIKEVVLPSTVKAIPNGLFRASFYLEKVENTEQIESIGTGAFMFTRVREMRFPNLKTMSNQPFINCSCLTLVDVGKITSIGKRTFQYCENLSEVVGGENVTQIGEEAFFGTRRLKNLSFLANVNSIGTKAFFSSRCDFEDVYDTLVANGCTFGTYATYKQYGSEDYWSGVTFTPCKTPLKSLFHQRNPLWKDKQIASYIERYEDGTPVLDEDGNEIPCTYGGNGCAFITLAEIYSAFEGVSFTSPEEFVTILEQKKLLQYDYRYRSGWRAIAEGLGYEVKDMDADIDEGETEHKTKMSKDDLQEIYDALAAGALVYRSTGSSTPDGGHATLWYGINSEGEALVSDTSMHCDGVGIYENHKSAWHTYKNGSQLCDAVIVKKKTK